MQPQDKYVENPPFNFQGMLRKTKYNRASMKRTTLDENSMFPSSNNDDFNRSSPFGGSAGRSSPYDRDGSGGGGTNTSHNDNGNNSGHNSAMRNRTPESERSTTSHTVYKSSRPTSRQSNGGYDVNDNGDMGRRSTTPSWLDSGNSLDDAVYVNEEIRPGVVLEGYAIEI